MTGQPETKPVTLVILGGGQRGVVYASYAIKNPDLAKVVAVADPREHRRKLFERQHHLADDKIFADWKQVAALPRFADAVVISTLDQMHAPMVEVFAKLGYDILCEKPMATSVADCVSMVKHVEEASKAKGDDPLVFGIGHVLRYSPYNRAVKEVIDSGALGEIINIQHMEPVGNQHFAHSFVRGNWSKEQETTFGLMSKCCHDLDILSFYVSGQKPVRVSSFGSVGHFKPSRKPKEAKDAHRCLECPAEQDCVWSARKIYLSQFDDPERKKGGGWATIIVEGTDVTKETVTDALEKGPYGVCVYEAGNDVVDHQVVNIEYEGGATVGMTMSAFTESECARQTVIQGTKGELVGDMVSFSVFDFLTRTKKHYKPDGGAGAHGGGDGGLSGCFIRAVAQRDQSQLGVTPDEVLNSHLIVFAAEKARREGRVVEFDAFKAEAIGA